MNRVRSLGSIVWNNIPTQKQRLQVEKVMCYTEAYYTHVLSITGNSGETHDKLHLSFFLSNGKGKTIQ